MRKPVNRISCKYAIIIIMILHALQLFTFHHCENLKTLQKTLLIVTFQTLSFYDNNVATIRMGNLYSLLYPPVCHYLSVFAASSSEQSCHQEASRQDKTESSLLRLHVAVC